MANFCCHNAYLLLNITICRNASYSPQKSWTWLWPILTRTEYGIEVVKELSTKGILIDGTIIAVKESKIIDARQVEQFVNKVIILSEINQKCGQVVRILFKK